MLTFLRWFLEADFRHWKYRSSDFFIAILSLAYGVWAGSLPWSCVGLAGLGLAAINPALRLQQFLLSHMRSRAGRAR